MDELIRHPPGTAQEEVDARQEQEEQSLNGPGGYCIVLGRVESAGSNGEHCG